MPIVLITGLVDAEVLQRAGERGCDFPEGFPQLTG